MNKFGYVYIMTNKNKTTLYIGVTNDLVRRVYEHKNHLIKKSFTDTYNLEYCIYYEEFTYIESAINREKELKKWSRKKKEDLINKKNPEWKELVNEKGFIRELIEVSRFARNDDSANAERERGAGELIEVSRFARNDNATTASKGKSGGGWHEIPQSLRSFGMTTRPLLTIEEEAGAAVKTEQIESICAAPASSSPFFASECRHFERSEKSRTNEETIIKN